MKQMLMTSCLITGLAGFATAQDHRFGVGGIIGEPTGLSWKAWLSEKTAIDGAFAWSFKDEENFHIHADYLWHKFDLFEVGSGRLPLYFGVGGRVKFGDHEDTRAGVRGPVGLAYLFDNVPVDVFVEVGPVLDLEPKTKLEWTGGIGARFWF